MFDQIDIELIEYYLEFCYWHDIQIDFDDFEVFKEEWWLDKF